MTTRRAETLDMLCRGMPPKQIAREMHLSVHTVRQYVADLKAEHRVPSTTALVAKVLTERACTCGAAT